MIKNNQRIFNRLQVLIDAVIIAFSYVFAWYFRFQSGIFSQDAGVLPVTTYMAALVFVVPGYLFLYYLFQLYMPRRVQSRRMELWNITRANMIGLMAFILVLYFIKQEHFSRQMLFIFFGSNILFEAASRYVIRYALQKMRRKGFNQKHIVLVGCSRAAQQYLERIHRNPHWGYQVMGILSDEQPADTQYYGASVLGKTTILETLLAEHDFDEIVITLGMKEYEKLEEIVDICEKAGVHTKFVPDYGNVIPTRPYIEDVQGMPVINIRRVPLHLPVNRWIKRMIDVSGAAVGIILFSPIMLITTVLVKYTTKGPVIYRQERVGLHNKKFCMYKFRSMVVQDEECEKKEWSKKNDPRITPIGKWIRKTSIDELPQLFNVLKGEMSLVGPRPERPQFVEKFRDEIPRYMVKHQVRPGMTGWAQVNGYRGDTSIRKRIEHDLYYIENWTLGLDFKIIMLTFFKGFMSE